MIIHSLLLSATAPGSSGVAATVDGGSLTLRPDHDARLVFVAGMTQSVVGRLQLTAPSGHDASFGASYAPPEQRRAYVFSATPRFNRGETITARIAGSTTAGDQELYTLAIAYPSVEGAMFVSAADALDGDETHSMFGSLTPTQGVIPPGVTLSSFQDSLRAGRRYALQGWSCGNQQDILGLAIRGPDTGNLWQIWPAWMNAMQSVQLAHLAAWKDVGVPVIQSGNASQTVIGLIGNENATARTTTLYWSLLRK